MIEEQWKRVLRMREQSLYLIAIDENLNNATEEVVFRISGSTANLYSVTLNFASSSLENFINCNCPDSTGLAWDHRVKCKHCCFVLCKILKQELQLLGQILIKPDKMEQIKLSYNNLNINSNLVNQEYRKKYLKLTTNTSKTDPEGLDKEEFRVTKEIEPNTECPICCDIFKEVGTLSQCPTCKNVVHSNCIQKWLSLGNNSCIYCRSDWSQLISSQKKPENLSGYLNLGKFRNHTYFGSSEEESSVEESSEESVESTENF